MNSPKILVSLYSDANVLALNILEIILSKNCFVYVFSDDVQRWSELTTHLTNKSHFRIFGTKEEIEFPPFDYSIFCGGFISKGDAYKMYFDFAKRRKIIGPKTLSIFPFESYNPEVSALLNVGDGVGIIYVGDLIGPRIDLTSDLLVSQLTYEVLNKREMTISSSEQIYPLFVSDVARIIAKWLFSFGPYGKELFLLGPRTTANEYWALNARVIGDIKLNYSVDSSPRIIPRNIEVKTAPVNLKVALTETYRWFSHNKEAASIRVKHRPPQKIRKPRKYPKFLKPLLISFAGILIFPYMMFVIAGGLFFLSYKDLVSGRTDSATGKILASKTFLTIGGAESRGLSYIPILGRIYGESAFISRVGTDTTDLVVSVVPFIRVAQELSANILGDSPYDPTPASLEIKGELGDIYVQISKIEAETVSAKNNGILTARLLLSRVDFSKLKNLALQGEIISEDLPSILGVGQRKTYLVLFQNNMELRPTGGFIGSFGLLTFDGGRMSELTVNDVYSADGQLRGHVEPPAPIKNYLNEANWWLRDSNWDPDFPTSAQRAEWFLDKEIDTQVDGVFAIDLNPIREILGTTGPIFLADYNLDITKDNLYEKTQAEAQENFFPGSRQKASFLTALSRNLIEEVKKLSPGQKLSVLKLVYSNFAGRHIQAFLHNDKTENALASLSWNGEVATPSCGDGCYADLVGIIEANVGDNKANYFITRQVALDVNLSQGSVVRNLVLNLKNSANPALGPSGVYKVYVRTFIPDGAVLNGVLGITGDTKEVLKPEIVESHGRQEVGVIVEVLAGQSQKIQYTWTTDTASSYNAYGLYIRKQAGVGDDPWNITLTDGVSKTYNTVLGQDFLKKWTQKF